MLCPLTLDGLLKSLQAVPMSIGKDYNVLTVSFNPRETPEQAAIKQEDYVRRYNRASAANGWHFLTGDDPSIQALTKAVGFRYVYDPASKQYAHANGIMVLTPQGKIAQYFYGIEYRPLDVRLGLVEASANKIGTRADQVLLYCLHYDPKTGQYGVLIMRVIRAAGTATVLLIGAVVLMLSRRERKAGKTGNV
jgi:protein SCO1/2